ncbi:MAG: hypothetical protein IJT27_03650 [Clostridia bacterium]|nr:hypothetical protein [Clostridia bacterium]
MLKGVNRQVVEIPQPESDYFEKVILFVKPQYYGVGEAGLREKAAAVIKNTVKPPAGRFDRKEIRIASVLRLILAAASGAAIFALVQVLLR